MQHSECFHTFLDLALTDIRDVFHISRDTPFCNPMNTEKCRTSNVAADLHHIYVLREQTAIQSLEKLLT